MEAIIVSVSRSPHGNTAVLAECIATVLGAPILGPEEATPDVLSKADLIGFGSGIYYFDYARELVDAVKRLPDMGGRAAFAFSTSGTPEPPFRRYTTKFERQLTNTGFAVVGSFTSRGFDTWGPARLLGGVNKCRPDADDLDRGRTFARGLLHQHT